jgi:hypothetical protein
MLDGSDSWFPLRVCPPGFIVCAHARACFMRPHHFLSFSIAMDLVIGIFIDRADGQ